MVKKTLTLLVTSLTLITSLISCGKIQVSQVVSSEDEIEIVFIVEPRLDQDENGYYHLELNPSTFQTLHRLSGHTYLNGEPLNVMKFNWESSHFWMLGDTLYLLSFSQQNLQKYRYKININKELPYTNTEFITPYGIFFKVRSK